MTDATSTSHAADYGGRRGSGVVQSSDDVTAGLLWHASKARTMCTVGIRYESAVWNHRQPAHTSRPMLADCSVGASSSAPAQYRPASPPACGRTVR